nr:hypothetical protein B0A51_12277 [Rachicladosporium sp. CCFEE 5018]
MDRLARDAAARYGSSPGGGSGYYDSYGRRSAMSSSHPYSGGRRESRRSSHAPSRRLERSPPRYERRESRSNRYGVPFDRSDRDLSPRRERRNPYTDRSPLSTRNYEQLRRSNRYSVAGLQSSVSPYHNDAERRPSSMASYHEGRRRASLAQAARASYHINALSRHEDDNRRAAQRYVIEDYTRRESDAAPRRLYDEEVPARYGGGDLLSQAAAERRRANSSHWDI